MASGQRMADAEKEETAAGHSREKEHILLAVNHEETVDRMVNLGLLIKAETNKDRLFALNVINEDKNESSVQNAEKVLELATDTAAAADVQLQPLTRYDNDVIRGINNVLKERKITVQVLDLEDENGFYPALVYNLHNYIGST